MVWRIIRRRGTIPLVLILVALGYWWLRPKPPKFIAVGYVGDRSVTVWNTLAQVRQPVAEIHYGDRVEVVRIEGTATQIRTSSGALGWLTDSRQIMDATLWEQSAALLQRAKVLPVQARGRTKTVSNVRIEPGRNGKRVIQLGRATPVVVLERTVADVPQTIDDSSSDEKKPTDTSQKPKQEAWLLVLRTTDAMPLHGGSSKPASDPSRASAHASGDPVSSGSSGMPSSLSDPDIAPIPIAGWVLARFIELDLPDPIRDYASSADLRVIAWFELNRVADGSGGVVPQYLVTGARGPEGQVCDFTILRVYTWGSIKKRYETAYVESDVCGRLPVRISNTQAGPQFRFVDLDQSSGERTYVMQQTSVRRVIAKSAAKSAAPNPSGKR